MINKWGVLNLNGHFLIFFKKIKSELIDEIFRWILKIALKVDGEGLRFWILNFESQLVSWNIKWDNIRGCFFTGIFLWLMWSEQLSLYGNNHLFFHGGSFFTSPRLLTRPIHTYVRDLFNKIVTSDQLRL